MKKKWYPALIVIVIVLIAAFVLAPLRNAKTATASAAGCLGKNHQGRNESRAGHGYTLCGQRQKHISKNTE